MYTSRYTGSKVMSLPFQRSASNYQSSGVINQARRQKLFKQQFRKQQVGNLQRREVYSQHDNSYYKRLEKPEQPQQQVPNNCNSNTKVVFITNEVAPWSKVGGLADVMAELPVELAQRGFKVMTISPRYENYPDVYDIGLRVPINLESKQGQELIQKVLVDFYEKQARTTNTQRTLQSFRNLTEHLRHAKLYTKFDRGVQRVFVDHPIYQSSLQSGQDAPHRIYTYYNSVSNLQQLMLDILGQASLTAPLAFWDQDIYYGRNKDYPNQQFQPLLQQNGHVAGAKGYQNGKVGDKKEGNKIVYIANDWHQASFGVRLSQLRDRFQSQQSEITRMQQLLDRNIKLGQGAGPGDDGKMPWEEGRKQNGYNSLLANMDSGFLKKSEFGRRLNRQWVKQRLTKSIRQAQSMLEGAVGDGGGSIKTRTLEQTLKNRYLSPLQKEILVARNEGRSPAPSQDQDQGLGKSQVQKSRMVYSDDWDMNQQQRAISTGLDQPNLDRVLTQYLGNAKLVNYVHNFAYQGTFTEAEYRNLALPEQYISNFQISKAIERSQIPSPRAQNFKINSKQINNSKGRTLQFELTKLLEKTDFKSKLNSSLGSRRIKDIQFSKPGQENRSKPVTSKLLQRQDASFKPTTKQEKGTNVISWQKGILNLSDAIVTVSQSYSDEIYKQVTSLLRPSTKTQQTQEQQLDTSDLEAYQKISQNNDLVFRFPFMMRQFSRYLPQMRASLARASASKDLSVQRQQIESQRAAGRRTVAEKMESERELKAKIDALAYEMSQSELQKVRDDLSKEREDLQKKLEEDRVKFADFVMPNEKVDEEGKSYLEEYPPLYEVVQTRESQINGDSDDFKPNYQGGERMWPKDKGSLEDFRAERVQNIYEQIQLKEGSKTLREASKEREGKIKTALGMLGDIQNTIGDKLWRLNRRNAKENLKKSGVDLKKFFGGFTNGLDMELWNPEKDPNQSSDLRYDADSADFIKPLCKRTLQQTLGLPENEAIPLYSFIGRLDDIKGIQILLKTIYRAYNTNQDLIRIKENKDRRRGGFDYSKGQQGIPGIVKNLFGDNNRVSQIVFDIVSGKATKKMKLNWPRGEDTKSTGDPKKDSILNQVPGDDLKIQFVVMGQGEEKYEQQLANLRTYFPNMCAGVVGMNEGLARKILAGSDFVIIPSLYEPCGLIAMQAQRYGAIPILSKIGGLQDVCDDKVGLFYDGPNAQVNALREQWTQDQVNKLFDRILYAKSIFRTDNYKQRRLKAMRTDYSWDTAASSWEDLIQKLVEE